MESLGKQVGTRRYVHAEQVSALPQSELGLVAQAIEKLPGQTVYNLVRIDLDRNEVAFLSYPELGDSPFPSLAESWRVHVPTSLVTRRKYADSLNPPILHRTELLLSESHPKRSTFSQLTQACEAIGLFDNTTIIGFKRNWEELIASKGYGLQAGALVPVGNETDEVLQSSIDGVQIQRHRTALSRTSLSAPVQCLLRDGLLTADSTFFDYGCGKGDDLASLSANGFSCGGWDPHFRKDAELHPANVVNLGFVINVIEDYDERVHALQNAFSLAQHVLAVSAMIATNVEEKFSSYRDGVVTRRQTFQKYFAQGELQHFIESVVGEDAYSASPGVFYVFKDRTLEQRYLLRKTRGISRNRPTITVQRPPKPPKEAKAPREVLTKGLSREEMDLLDRLWSHCVSAGRLLGADEVPFSNELGDAFGSFGKALRRCREQRDAADIESGAEARRADICVMLALLTFERRRRLEALDPGLARDIRYFFGAMRDAEAAARTLLFSIQDQVLILDACRAAAIAGLGYFEAEQALHLHTSLVNRLPAVLRVFVGCASAMAGDLASYDVAKIHVGSGKVTLLQFDDFEGAALPALVRRVKVRLRDQASDIFDYGGQYPSTLLFNKSRYINEEYPHYAEQVAFEEALQREQLLDESPHGPTAAAYLGRLRRSRFRIHKFELLRSDDVPSLDEKCGENFCYRDLIECGSTWDRLRVDNVPRSADTFNSLCDLARAVLDPVVEYYGSIQITYGFASSTLTRNIDGNIAPRLDQHASCELSRNGRHICDRLGAAVDFLVEFEDMKEVAQWVAANCAYDRIYFYGHDRPIHVSVGPDQSREVFQLVEHETRRVPKRLIF